MFIKAGNSFEPRPANTNFMSDEKVNTIEKLLDQYRPDWANARCSECNELITKLVGVADVFISTFWDIPSKTVTHKYTCETCAAIKDAHDRH